MYDDRLTNGDEAANNEPGLTERNSRTVVGEEELAHDSEELESNVESYGEHGEMVPSSEE